MKIRQIALAANDLAPAVERLGEVLDTEVTYRDPLIKTFGLRNALFTVGSDFIEVVAPLREDASAARFLKSAGGDAGYMVIFQTDDLAAERARIEALGVRVVWEAALDEIATIHLHPRDMTAAIVSIDEARPAPSWHWAGPDWETGPRSGRASGITGVELAARDPRVTAERWSQVVRAEARPAADGAFEIALDAGRIRVLPCSPGEREGISRIELRAASPDFVGRVQAGGVEFVFS